MPVVVEIELWYWIVVPELTATGKFAVLLHLRIQSRT